MCRPAITSELRLPGFWPMLTASLFLSIDRPPLTHADPLHGPWPGALPAASHTVVTSLYLSSSSLKGTLFPPPQTPFLIWSFKKKKKKVTSCVFSPKSHHSSSFPGPLVAASWLLRLPCAGRWRGVSDAVEATGAAGARIAAHTSLPLWAPQCHP